MNIKKNLIITKGIGVRMFVAFLILICCLNISCEKFLDIKQDSSVSLIESADDCQLLLNDYANMNINFPSDGEVSADDYYLNDASYLGISADDQPFYTWAAGAIRPAVSASNPQWLTPYHVVYLSNLVIETVDKLKGSNDQTVLNDLRGQALFFRAFSYWQIAQLYTKPYTVGSAGQDPGIPIRLQSDINGFLGRGTLQETYDRITGDLNEAVNLLNTTSTIASRPNKAAAYAMLARVYLSMDNYNQALTSATSALQLNSQLLDYNTLSTSSNTPFTRFNKEVIFHAVTAAGATLNPGSATGNVAKINPAIVASYNTNDLRGIIFIKPNSGSHAGSFRFTGNYQQTTSATFFNGLAVDEVYLTRAECYARSGNISGAMADLNILLKTRWKTGTYIDITSATADEALGKVLTERRKELLMRGLRWTDLRRLNKDSRFAATLTRTVNGVTYTLPPNDLRYTLLIPVQVITQNTNIQQNPR